VPSDDVPITKLSKAERIRKRKWAKQAFENGLFKCSEMHIDVVEMKKTR